MPEKQAAVLVAVESLRQRTSFLERALDTRLPLEACRGAGNGAQWAYDKVLELPGAAKAQSCFQEWCPDSRLTLQPHQLAQPRLSTRAGGLGLPLTEARRMPAFFGSRVVTMPEVLADLPGPLGDRVRRGIPESGIISQSEVACPRFETYGGQRRKRWQASFPNLGRNGVWA